MAGAVLQQALGGQPQAQSQAQQDPLDLLMAEYNRLKDETPKPMYSPEQQRQRIETNNTQVDAGIIGSLSPDHQLAGTGGSILKQALGARAPIKTVRGQFDPLTGETAVDPGYAADRLDQQRGRVLQQFVNVQNQRQMQQDRLEQQRMLAEQRMDMMRALQQMRLDAKAASGSGHGGDHNWQLKYDPEANGWVAWDPRNPTQAPVALGGGAKPGPEPGAGLQTKMIENRGALANIDTAIQAVSANPAAFGMQNVLPDAITQRLPGASMAGGVAARAAVANISSQKVHDRSGATVTIAEMPRLQPFIPGPRDDARVVATKLRGLRVEAEKIQQELEAGYPLSRFVGNLRAGSGVQAGPTPGSGAPSAAVTPASPSAPTGGRATRLRLNPQTGELEPVR
jgi:hypothetical protein